jgi:NADPH:quinone reductase-like Zn-dependent oxidoreductase
VKNFKVGDEVFGLNSKGGTYSNYSTFKESELCLKPKTMTFEEASILPTLGLTSYQSLVKYGNIQEGQKVLIIGASSNIARYSIILSKHFGCEVIGVCGKNNFSKILRETKIDDLYDYEEYCKIIFSNFKCQ